MGRFKEWERRDKKINTDRSPSSLLIKIWWMVSFIEWKWSPEISVNIVAEQMRQIYQHARDFLGKLAKVIESIKVSRETITGTHKGGLILIIWYRATWKLSFKCPLMTISTLQMSNGACRWLRRAIFGFQQLLWITSKETREFHGSNQYKN